MSVTDLIDQHNQERSKAIDDAEDRGYTKGYEMGRAGALAEAARVCIAREKAHLETRRGMGEAGAVYDMYMIEAGSCADAIAALKETK